MLVDSAHIQESDAEYRNKKRKLEDRELIQPLYTIEEARASLTHFKSIPYEKWVKIDDEIELCFTVIGHILGAAAINFKNKRRRTTH